jgi:hypothetical protein
MSRFVLSAAYYVYIDVCQYDGQQRVFLSVNRMWNVVPAESVEENFVLNFLGTQFQAQETFMNL